MHEEHTIHPNSTIVVLSNVSISAAASNNVSIVGNSVERVTTDTNNRIDSLLSDSVKLNLDSSGNSNTTTQYFFSTNTPIVTTSTNQLQSNNNNTILIDESNTDIIVCNGDDTITVTSVPNVTTSCSTSSCATSCSAPYVIFETNNLPYIQRTVVTERDAQDATVCIDDSGGTASDTIDNNNIDADDDAENNANELILKRTTSDHVFDNADIIDDENEEDDTSQGNHSFKFYSIFFLKQIYNRKNNF